MMDDDQGQALKAEFHERMYKVYRDALKECGYNATIFMGMVENQGGLSTAHFLLRQPNVSDGFTALFLKGRLDLTIEAVVTNEAKWQSLFTAEDLLTASTRLEERSK